MKITLQLKNDYIISTTYPAYSDKDLKDDEINFEFDGNYFEFCDKIKLNITQVKKVNNKYILEDNQTALLSQNNFCKLTEELNTLYEWFNEYDLQVKQAERAIRLNQSLNIHINNVQYKSLKELDLEANKKQERLHELRNLIN